MGFVVDVVGVADAVGGVVVVHMPQILQAFPTQFQLPFLYPPVVLLQVLPKPYSLQPCSTLLHCSCVVAVVLVVGKFVAARDGWLVVVAQTGSNQTFVLHPVHLEHPSVIDVSPISAVAGFVVDHIAVGGDLEIAGRLLLAAEYPEPC